MNKCELCDSLAKIFCESDQASLCWDCDAQVHGANFLVAKHSRTLLCHVCQSLTPWNGSGRKLGPTVSVCENCVNGLNQNEARNQGNNEEDDDEDHVGDNLEEDDEDNSDDDDDDDDDGDGGGGGGGDDEDEDEEENQVVPWSFTPPPPVSCSSTSEECSNRLCNSEESPSKSKSAFLWKRMRHSSTDLCAQKCYHILLQKDQNRCLPSQLKHKDRKRTADDQNSECRS